MENKFKSVPVKSSEITPYSEYISRRDFLKAAGIVTGSALLAACAPKAAGTAVPAGDAGEAPVVASGLTDELGDPANSFEDITNYNNFYEFTSNKTEVARLARDLRTSSWEVQVGGLVNKPKTYSVGDFKKFSIQERIYRLRCVEAWSMVIPWMGLRLHRP